MTICYDKEQSIIHVVIACDSLIAMKNGRTEEKLSQDSQCQIPLKANKATALGPAPKGAPQSPDTFNKNKIFKIMKKLNLE